MFLKRVQNLVLDLLFPINCLGCGREGFWLCDSCKRKVKFNYHFICPICKKNSAFGQVCEKCQGNSFIDGCLVALSYNDQIIQKLVKIFKYKYIEEVGNLLGEWLCHFLDQIYNKGIGYNSLFENKKTLLENIKVPEILLDFKKTILIPVPLHKRRLVERGYNQSEILARKLSEKFGFIYDNKILKRKRYTHPQAKLEKKERLSNVKEAFNCLDDLIIKNKKIILIDDVYTTGSTVQECAKVLKKSGAEEVWVLVLARG